jgi:hypothetical protein
LRPLARRSGDRAGATVAEAWEHQMTLGKAFKLYWKVGCTVGLSRCQQCPWFMLSSIVLLMEGFDSIGGNSQAFQNWLQSHGQSDAEKVQYVIRGHGR